MTIDGIRYCPDCKQPNPSPWNYCPKCKATRQRAYAKRTNYKDNKKSLPKQRKARREFIAATKNKPCQDCGVKYPTYVMDYDHVRGEKNFDLANISSVVSKKRVLEEIAKCDLVCSNCHRIRTYKRSHHETC